jgi:hypothetical protein
VATRTCLQSLLLCRWPGYWVQGIVGNYYIRCSHFEMEPNRHNCSNCCARKAMNALDANLGYYPDAIESLNTTPTSKAIRPG